MEKMNIEMQKDKRYRTVDGRPVFIITLKLSAHLKGILFV